MLMFVFIYLSCNYLGTFISGSTKLAYALSFFQGHPQHRIPKKYDERKVLRS